MSISFPAKLRPPDTHEISAWAVWLGRFGLAARGAVYLMLGVLAVRAGTGEGSRATDQQGAVRALGDLPFGNAILWAIGFGLAGYVVWRLAQAFLDVDHYGRDHKGSIKRIGAFLSAVSYGALALVTVKLAAGRGSSGSGSSSAEDQTAWLLDQPFGRTLVAAVGLIILGVALFQFYQALKAGFARRLSGQELTAAQQKWSILAGRIGHAARGVAFSLIGSFFLRAAMQSDPSEAGGLSMALTTLSRQEHGPWLLAVVGAGLGLFGVYSLIESRYRRIG